MYKFKAEKDKPAQKENRENRDFDSGTLRRKNRKENRPCGKLQFDFLGCLVEQ